MSAVTKQKLHVTLKERGAAIDRLPRRDVVLGGRDEAGRRFDLALVERGITD